MEKKITQAQIAALAKKYGLPYAHVRAIIEVEGAGSGYSEKTGKILIQFEPAWFKRNCEEWKRHANPVWLNNGVGDQTEEWKAFNAAFAEDADAAMQSASIGMMQVMGFHFAALGFKTVGEMWDFAKISEANQVEIGLMFISKNKALYNAVKTGDCYHIAYYYNGAGFMELAEKTKSVPYDERIKKQIARFI